MSFLYKILKIMFIDHRFCKMMLVELFYISYLKNTIKTECLDKIHFNQHVNIVNILYKVFMVKCSYLYS